MWWSETSALGAAGRVAALALTLVAGACGFRPLYGTTSDQAPMIEQLSQIEVGVIPDRSGQILRNYLLEQLNPRGRPTSPGYLLAVSITESQQELGIRSDDTATRANLRINADMILDSAIDDEPLLRRRLNTVTSYNILDDEFATLSSERAARDRALRQLSEDIRTQLALYFRRDG